METKIKTTRKYKPRESEADWHLKRKTRFQKEALWELYRRYEGKIPGPEEIDNLTAMLNLKKKTIYKWFWDTIKREKKRKELVK